MRIPRRSPGCMRASRILPPSAPHRQLHPKQVIVMSRRSSRSTPPRPSLLHRLSHLSRRTATRRSDRSISRTPKRSTPRRPHTKVKVRRTCVALTMQRSIIRRLRHTRQSCSHSTPRHRRQPQSRHPWQQQHCIHSPNPLQRPMTPTAAGRHMPPPVAAAAAAAAAVAVAVFTSAILKLSASLLLPARLRALYHPCRKAADCGLQAARMPRYHSRLQRDR